MGSESKAKRGGRKMYIRCKFGFHKWDYAISSRVCMYCGRIDNFVEWGIWTMTSPPIYTKGKENEIKETLIFLEYIRRQYKS
jgi:ribosomal protein L32